LPSATVVVPVRNEARTIRACLDAVAAQDYPGGRLEVLVLDGGSRDDTRELVEEAAAAAAIPIRLIDNPGRSVPAALNIALREASGDYLVRVDGHSEPVPGYVRRLVEANEELDADLTGGWVEAVGEGLVGRAVAAAFTSPVAMGNPVSFKQPNAPVEVISVPCGSYRISALRAIGGFDEEQRANQDYEANYRLRRAGGRVYLLPDVSFTYLARDTFGRLAKQFVRYGYYKARTMSKHPASMRPRHLVPATALVLLVALAALAPFSRPALLVLAAAGVLYVLLLVLASVRAGRGLGAPALLLPAVFATMHLSWGAGNLAGLVRWLPRRRTLASTPLTSSVSAAS
jgi:glycosyltransferase involved in cell wall biosynthesis